MSEERCGIVINQYHGCSGSGGSMIGSTGEIEEIKRTLDNLYDRVNGLEKLGQWVGTFDNYASVPVNINDFPVITINDFINVRTDENHDGDITRYIAAAIDTNGTITWHYDISYDVDLSGKADKVVGATPGNLAVLDADGNLVDSGRKVTDLIGAALLPDLSTKALLASGTTPSILKSGVTVTLFTYISTKDQYVQFYFSGYAFPVDSKNRWLYRRGLINGTLVNNEDIFMQSGNFTTRSSSGSLFFVRTGDEVTATIHCVEGDMRDGNGSIGLNGYDILLHTKPDTQQLNSASR